MATFDRAGVSLRLERDERFQPLERFISAGAQGLVQAQEALDKFGAESIAAWDETGMPPVPLAWTECRMSFQAAFGCLPRRRAAERTQLRLAPRREHTGGLALTIRYLSTPQGEEQ